MILTDSLQLPPLSIPRAALDELIARGLLQVSPASPLSRLGAPSSSAREREAAFSALLRQGLSFSEGVRPSPNGALYQQALRILAAPDAFLRIRLQTPDGQVTEFGWFTAGDQAVLAPVSPKGVELGPPVPLTRMAAQLAGMLKSEAPPGREGARLWPTVVELATRIWVADGKADAHGAVTLGEALARLEQAGMSTDDASASIQGLIDGELLVEEKGALKLSEELAYWLELAWSGHVVEVAWEPLVEGVAAEDAGRRALFLGPPKQRALTELWDADELDLDEDEKLDDKVSVVCHLDDENLRSLLHSLLGLTRG